MLENFPVILNTIIKKHSHGTQWEDHVFKEMQYLLDKVYIYVYCRHIKQNYCKKLKSILQLVSNVCITYKKLTVVMLQHLFLFQQILMCTSVYSFALLPNYHLVTSGCSKFNEVMWEFLTGIN